MAGLLSLCGDVNILHMYLHGIVVARRQDRWMVSTQTDNFVFFLGLQWKDHYLITTGNMS